MDNVMRDAVQLKATVKVFRWSNGWDTRASGMGWMREAMSTA